MAAGELVPLVLIPRFSTYCGATDFVTVAMDVTDYQEAIVNVWRGPMAAGGTYNITFEESTDQDNWTVCTGGTGGDPGSLTEAQYVPTLKKRWFRAKITLGGIATPIATCWGVGFLMLRQS